VKVSITSVHVIFFNIHQCSRMSRDSLSLLQVAAIEGSCDVVQMILQPPRCVQIDARSRDGSTALHLACRSTAVSGQEQAVIVRALVRAGADVNATTLCGDTPMMLCCLNIKSVLPLRALLAAAGCNLAACNTRGFTALHCAALSANPIVMRELLATTPSLDVDAKCKLGMTPLGALITFEDSCSPPASRDCIVACARLLLRAGASPLASVPIDSVPIDSPALPPLVAAVSDLHVQMTALMLEHLDASSAESWWWFNDVRKSVLHVLVFATAAAVHAEADDTAFPVLLRMLVARGASLTRPDANGCTPFSFARMCSLRPEYCTMLRGAA